MASQQLGSTLLMEKKMKRGGKRGPKAQSKLNEMARYNPLENLKCCFSIWFYQNEKEEPSHQTLISLGETNSASITCSAPDCTTIPSFFSPRCIDQHLPWSHSPHSPSTLQSNALCTTSTAPHPRTAIVHLSLHSVAEFHLHPHQGPQL